VRVWVNPRTDRLQAEDRQQLMVLWQSLEEALPGIMPPCFTDERSGHSGANHGLGQATEQGRGMMTPSHRQAGVGILRERRGIGERPMMEAEGQFIPNNPEPHATWSQRKRIRTADLMQGAREVIIVHEEEEYVLRITRTGKLILTK
jgi:hemin uptake protein HemP